MSLILVISILIRLAAMGWSIVLLRQTRDWRMAFLTIMLGLMASRQIFTLWDTHKSWTLVVTGQTTELPGLIVSVMAFLAVYFLHHMLIENKQKEEKLRARESAINAILETSKDWIWTINLQGHHTYSNPAVEDILGYRVDELLGKTDLDLLHEEDRKYINTELPKWIAKKNGWNNLVLRWRHKNGTYRYLESTSVPILNTDGELTGYRGVDRDITDRKNAEKALNESEGRYRTLFEQTADAILIIEEDKFVDCNTATVNMLGYKNKTELLMTHPSQLSPQIQPDGRSSFEKANEMMSIAFDQGSHRFEWNHKRKNGEVFPVEVLLTSIPFGEKKFLHVVWRDITERWQAMADLNYQANHDALTGLTNRREFERQAEYLLAKVRQEQKEHALCFMDLDQFKVINDTCGHSAGDEMLRQLSLVLQNAVSNRDTLARLGGDEFGVLMEYCSIDDAQRVTTSLQKAIQDYQFSWEGRSFKVGVSMGLVPISNTTASLTELMRDADIACYMAKDKGRNCIHVSRNGDTEIAQRHGEMQWVTRINQAIEENQFCLYAQSIVPLDGSANKHYELLIRMLDANGQIIPPRAFLPSAERFNLISKIDYWVIQNTFALLADNPSFLEQIDFISINLSGSSLTKPETLSSIIEQLNITGIDGEKICFEITETAAITNMISATKFISTLKGLGCLFALDDFGSGLSSFGYLKNLHVDYLKIDGMFVKNIVDDPIDRAMVKSINEIGQVMGMQTIAECVENDGIIGMLKEIGINFGQGFGIGRPLDFGTLLVTDGDSKSHRLQQWDTWHSSR